jgi:hypothetical protein
MITETRHINEARHNPNEPTSVITATPYFSLLAFRQYLDINQAVVAEYFKLEAYYQNFALNLVVNHLNAVLVHLLHLNPPAINATLTSEQSIYYTLRIGRRTFFFQHFLRPEDDDDEALLAVFQDDVKLPSIGGSLKEVLGAMINLSSSTYPSVSEKVFDGFSR